MDGNIGSGAGDIAGGVGVSAGEGAVDIAGWVGGGVGGNGSGIVGDGVADGQMPLLGTSYRCSHV